MDRTTEQPQSEHARKRMQQRAIKAHEARIVLTYGDRTKAVGGEALAVSLTFRAAQDLAAEGAISASAVNRLSRLAVVLDRDDNTIITVAWLHGRKSRVYTRGANVH